MNDRTESLLAGIGQRQDTEGALALADLPGQISGVKDNLELDVYALWNEWQFPSRPRRQARNSFEREVGLKNEHSSIVKIAKQTRRMRKLHNALTNHFRSAIRWKYGNPLEGPYDLLIRNWRRGHDLLIEAKTSSSGTSGRFQVRTAIGQLIDYRFGLNHENSNRSYDLAVLLPKEPSKEVIELLRSANIHTLWFESGLLTGNIRL